MKCWLILANSQTPTQSPTQYPLLWDQEKTEERQEESRAEITRSEFTVVWQDKCHKPKCLPVLLLSLNFYCWAQCHMAWNSPFISWGQLYWLCHFPAFCSPSACLLGMGMGEREKVLTLSGNSQNVVLSTVFYPQMQNTMRNSRWWFVFDMMLSGLSFPQVN